MDNIMLELLKCDSIAATSIISDLQLNKYKSLVNTYEAQISSLNAAQNTSDNYANMLKGTLQKETERNTKLEQKIIRNRKIAVAATLVALAEFFYLIISTL